MSNDAGLAAEAEPDTWNCTACGGLSTAFDIFMPNDPDIADIIIPLCY
jgi:hypothetical protein